MDKIGCPWVAIRNRVYGFADAENRCVARRVSDICLIEKKSTPGSQSQSQVKKLFFSFGAFAPADVFCQKANGIRVNDCPTARR